MFVFKFCVKYGFSANIRGQQAVATKAVPMTKAAMKGYRQWRWHLDEVFVKINGERHYLWRAVDHQGEILESYVTKKRYKPRALRFLKKALKRHGQPRQSLLTA
jgi:transposase-like protein